MDWCCAGAGVDRRHEVHRVRSNGNSAFGRAQCPGELDVRFSRVRDFARMLGVIEIATGMLIALRSVSPKASVVGSVLAIGTVRDHALVAFLDTRMGAQSGLSRSFSVRPLPDQGCRSLGSLGLDPGGIAEGYRIVTMARAPRESRRTRSLEDKSAVDIENDHASSEHLDTRTLKSFDSEAFGREAG